MWGDHERKQHGGMVWQQHSSRIRAEVGLAREAKPWTSKSTSRLIGVGSAARKLDVIDVAWGSMCVEYGKTHSEHRLRTNFWVDCSQTISRRPWGTRMRSFRSRCQVYSFEKDRVLSGTDAMLVYGWPRHYLDGTSQSDLLSLAEVATCVPIVTLVMACVWSNPWGDWHGVR